MEWMQRNGGSIHFALLLKMPGNADGSWIGRYEMESRFERITESPDALAAVLASIPTADAPWI